MLSASPSTDGPFARRKRLPWAVVAVALGTLVVWLGSRASEDRSRNGGTARTTGASAGMESAGEDLDGPLPSSLESSETRRPVPETTGEPHLPESDEVRFLSGLVLERSGVPRGSARCELRSGLSASGFVARAPGDEGLVRAWTLSGEDGAFRLEAGPGDWKVRVAALGFAPWERDHLRAGDRLVVRLDPEVLVSVVVSGPEGEPVADARLIVRARETVSPEDFRLRMETDAGGVARTTELAPGSWSLTVRRAGYGITTVPLEVPRARSRVAVDVRLEQGLRLVGQVRSPGGAPISGASLRIESPYLDGFLVEETTSGIDGRYETPAIFSRRETLEVLARAPGYAEANAFVSIQPTPDAKGEVVADFVLPESGRTLLGRAISGTGEGIAGATVRIAAFDPIGAHLEDLVEAMRGSPRQPWLWQEGARADGGGRFQLSGLSATPQYALLIVAEPFAPSLVWAPPGDPDSVTELGDVELSEAGCLFGRAIHADGSPAEGARLSLQRDTFPHLAPGESLADWRPPTWFLPFTTYTQEEGLFRFDGLAPGAYSFLAPDSPSHHVPAGEAVGPVEVVIAEDLPSPDSDEVELKGVIEDRAGLPTSNAFVRAFALASGQEARLLSAGLASVEGRFTLRLRAGETVRLVVTDLRGVYADHEQLLRPERAPPPLRIVLEPRPERLPPIEGLVLDPRGAPLEGCAVRLHPPEDALCACATFHAVSDATGAFRFESLSEGPHRLVVSDARFAPWERYPVRPGETLLIELEPR